MYRKLIITIMLAAGWYLMLPPAGQQNGMPWPDNTAPFSRWTIAESFDTAKGCEAELAKNRKQFERTYRKTNQADPEPAFWSRFYVTAAGIATCVASDDVRLKENADEGNPDLKKSTDQEPPHN